MMAEETFFSAALRISVILLVLNAKEAGGFLNGWFSTVEYTTVHEVSPERVASYLAPGLNEMADAIVNAEKKNTEELEQITSRYIQTLSNSFSNDLKDEAKSLKQILSEMLETHDMTQKNAVKLDETKQAITKTRAEVDKVEDETLANYKLLVQIVDTLNKQENMWKPEQVMALGIPLGTLVVLLLLALVWQCYRQQTKTDRKLQWLAFSVCAESRFKDDLGSNNKKNFEFENPMITNGPDNC